MTRFYTDAAAFRAQAPRDFFQFPAVDVFPSPIEHQFCLALALHWVESVHRYGSFAWRWEPQVRLGPYRVDVLCTLKFMALWNKRGLVVELDGHEFHKSKRARGRDAQRDRWLVAHGYEVMRFTGTQVHADPEGSALEVVRYLERLAGAVPHTERARA